MQLTEYANPETQRGVIALSIGTGMKGKIDRMKEMMAWCVDDSLVIRTIIQTLMRRLGIRVTVFPDGYHAWYAFNTQRLPVPDIIFLDLMMPRIDGFDLLRMLRANPAFDKTTVVMLTARDTVLTKIKSRLVGAQQFLGKPFRTEQIQAIIRDVASHQGWMPGPIGSRTGYNELPR